MNSMFALFFKNVDICLSFEVPASFVVVEFDAFGAAELG